MSRLTAIQKKPTHWNPLQSTFAIAKLDTMKSDIHIGCHVALTLRYDCNIRSSHACEYSAFHHSISLHAFMSLQVIGCQVKNHRHLTRHSYALSLALSYIMWGDLDAAFSTFYLKCVNLKTHGRLEKSM